MNTRTLIRLIAFAVFGFSPLWGQSPATPAAPKIDPLKPGAGRFDFPWANKPIPVWYYLPENSRPDTPVAIVMHGVHRDAKRYRDDWTVLSQKYHFILVVPEFSEADFPGSVGYAQGHTMDEKGQPLPRNEWTFSYIEPLFDTVKAAARNQSEHYYLFGHSAGSQFVHRFLYFEPEARVAKAIAANAGWWTLPDPNIAFPYGLRGSGVDDAALKTMLQRPLTVLLGTADTDPARPPRQKPKVRIGSSAATLFSKLASVAPRRFRCLSAGNWRPLRASRIATRACRHSRPRFGLRIQAAQSDLPALTPTCVTRVTPYFDASMSTREIIAELPHLTAAELLTIEQRISELRSRSGDGNEYCDDRGLHLERVGGRLVLVGPHIIQQADVEAILADFP
jgi:poly(3-hydroxybutyrate) depolymerase